MDGGDRIGTPTTAPRSIWARILEVLARANPLAALMRERDPRRTTAFTVGVVALGAKLAKADGRVTTDEVAVFRTVFHVETEDESRVAQVFNLCRQDTAGWDAYARQLARLFADDPSVLKDVLDALTAIAMADGEFHPAEEAFLSACAEIWGVPDGCRREIFARWVPDLWDPWEVLGVAPDASFEDARRKYRRLVRANHPDALVAKGLPEEMIELATRRLADVNRAWAEVKGALQSAPA